MSTALTVYENISDPVSAMKSVGSAIAKSKIFQLENEAQGEVFALECFVRRCSPFSLAQRFDLIHNRLSMKAEAMLAELLILGGGYRIVERSAERAALELTFGGNVLLSSLTWVEATKEPFVYGGKESDVLKLLASGKAPEIKPKYATPRSRMQMLWARAVSDGVRAICPGVNQGTYTPEEIDDFDGNGNGEATATKRGRPPKTEAAEPKATSPANGEAGEVVDAEYVVVPDAKPTTAAAAPAETKPVAAFCTAQQSDRIKELWGLLNVSVEDRNKQLAKRNASVARNLTAADAADLLEKLEELWAKRQQSAEPAKQAEPATTTKQPDQQPTPEDLTAPCGELADELRRLLPIVNQSVPGVAAKIREKMHAAGLQKFDELTRGDALLLRDALKHGGVEAFFVVALWPAPKPTNELAGDDIPF